MQSVEGFRDFIIASIEVNVKSVTWDNELQMLKVVAINNRIFWVSIHPGGEYLEVE
jgi:hypothetical protein